MLRVFTYVNQILTGQGTNFYIDAVEIGIRSVRMTPFHPQTDGLTEHLNQTLKQIKKSLSMTQGLIGTICCHTAFLPTGKFLRPPLASLHLSFFMTSPAFSARSITPRITRT